MKNTTTCDCDEIAAEDRPATPCPGCVEIDEEPRSQTLNVITFTDRAKAVDLVEKLEAHVIKTSRTYFGFRFDFGAMPGPSFEVIAYATPTGGTEAEALSMLVTLLAEVA